MAIVKDGALSSLGRDIEVTSEAVMEHMAQRLSFVDPGFSMEVFTESQLQVDLGPFSVLLFHCVEPCRMEVLPAQPCTALCTAVIHMSGMLLPCFKAAHTCACCSRLRQSSAPDQGRGDLQSFQDSCAACDIAVVEGVQEETVAERILRATAAVPTMVTFGCAPRLQAAMRLGGLPSAAAGYVGSLTTTRPC